MIVRTQEKRSVPVPFVSFFIFPFEWFYFNRFTRLFIIAVHISILILCVYNIRIGWINSRKKTIAAHGYKPIIIFYSFAAGGLRRTAHGIVILCSAVYIIKWIFVVYCNAVKLGNGQVSFKMKMFSSIVSLINSAITANYKMLIIVWVNP